MDDMQFINEHQRLIQEAAKRNASGLAKATTRTAEKRFCFSGKGFDYERKIKNKIHEYSSLSSRNRTMHNALQIVILVVAPIVPILLIITDVPKLFPTILSAVVAVAAAVGNHYKFGEHSRNYRLASEEMQQEYNWYETDREVYKDTSPEEAVSRFMDRTEAIMHKYTQNILS